MAWPFGVPSDHAAWLAGCMMDRVVFLLLALTKPAIARATFCLLFARLPPSPLTAENRLARNRSVPASSPDPPQLGPESCEGRSWNPLVEVDQANAGRNGSPGEYVDSRPWSGSLATRGTPFPWVAIVARRERRRRSEGLQPHPNRGNFRRVPPQSGLPAGLP